MYLMFTELAVQVRRESASTGTKVSRFTVDFSLYCFSWCMFGTIIHVHVLFHVRLRN
jgi:hypothetical protein